MSQQTKKTAAGKTAAGKKAKPVKKPVAGKTATGKKKSYVTPKVKIQKNRKAKKNAKPKLQTKNEFRYNHKTGHPNYIFGKTGKNYNAIGITHEEETFGRKNMPLGNNPQKGKMEKAYARNGIITDNKKSFSNKKMKNFEFSKEDKANVKSKIRNYKKNQKKKK